MTSTFRRAAAMAAAAAVSLVASVLPIWFSPMPEPAIHDEFAYLLQADTFLHGRLTNPSHPLSQFFETFHVIVQPTYAAKFPPGQGMALAAGMLMGHPLMGVWLSVAAACAAVAWMMLAFLPPRWAALGGIITALSPPVFWWSQVYWGGGVAMIGGALLCGAAARIVRHSSAHSRDATRRASDEDARRVASRLLQLGLVVGIGLAILANSRPFEGLILAFLLAGLVLFHALRRDMVPALLKYVTPSVAAIMIPAAGWMAYYNWRVTGDPFLMPYQLHARQYMVAPLMFWQHPRPMPHYRHDVLRQFYAEHEWSEYDAQTTRAGFFSGIGEKLYRARTSAVRPAAIWVPLIVGLLLIRRNRAVRWAVVVCAGMLVIHMACTPWFRLQYTAPVLGLYFLLATVGLRALGALRVGRWRIGPAIVAIVIVGLLVSGGRWANGYVRSPKLPFALFRATLVSELTRPPARKSLVFVRYSAQHRVLDEMVFNEADIDGSHVVFARDMGAGENRKLLEYYPNRRAMILEPDEARITPLDRPR